ncbi:hypothetical protein MMC17_008020 [Xylographa soralifera]|nr:hypothetical protein [Xylographa soralifera]
MAGKRTNAAKLNGTMRGKGGAPGKGSANQGNGGQGSGGGGSGGGNVGGGGDQGTFGTSNEAKPPDAAVTKAENEAVGLKRLSLKDSSFPRRPAYGSQEAGNLILRTNYFNVHLCDKSLLLYRYNLTVAPEEKQSRRRRRIVELLIKEGVFKEQGISTDEIATDWRSIILSTKELDFGTEARMVRIIRYYEAEETGPPSSNTTVGTRNNPTITIDKGDILAVQDLIDFITSLDGRAQDENNKNIVHALNIVMSRYPAVTPGIAVYNSKNKFFPLQQPTQGSNLGNGLVALYGFYASVRTATSRLLLNVNSISAAFYQDGKLRDLMDKHSPAPRPAGWEVKMERFVKGLRVELTHLPAKTKDGKFISPMFKKKVIYGFGRDRNQRYVSARQASFMYAKTPQQPEKLITVMEYFKQKYNITLSWPNEILINVGNRDNQVWVPPEVCRVLPGQPARFKLDSDQTKNMITFAARDPSRNEDLICKEGLPVLGIGQASGLANFGLAVVPEMITVHGRLLPPPFVTYLSNAKFQPSNGTWNLSGLKFSVAKELENWTYLHIRWNDDKCDLADEMNGVSRRITQLAEGVKSCGLTVQSLFNHPHHVLALDKWSDYEPFVVQRLKDIQLHRSRDIDHKRQQGKLKFLFVVLPDKNNTHLYNVIKKCADTELGFHTTCMASQKLYKAKAQYYANIAMKVNLKLGGSNQGAISSSLGILKQAGTMLIGIDVTHPSPGSRTSAPSIAACVANTDNSCGQWLGVIAVQESRVEMVQDLPAMVKSRLEIWKARNNQTLPKRIIVYRDGVSEDQYQTVLNEEWVPKVMGELVFKKLYGHSKNWPKVSIIVVGKRHHTRFFATRKEDTSGASKDTPNSNPKNGLVVDRGVTSGHMWDFFLQPHDAIKGTARPIHYVVIKDENHMDVDGLEKMTHGLCYLWGRATKSVSVCPPAYYADILCTRARCYLDNLFDDTVSESTGGAAAILNWTPVHANLRNTMFFV